jgi:hypothetical protein
LTPSLTIPFVSGVQTAPEDNVVLFSSMKRPTHNGQEMMT